MSRDGAEIPHFGLLSLEDQAKFCELRRQFSDPDSRYHRNLRIATFHACFAVLRSFCIRYEEVDWVRCLVCGVLWLGSDEIAINAQQLRHVLGKCKSSINGAFNRMHYDGVPLGSDQVKRITTAIPYLESHPSELRQWSIRRFSPHRRMNAFARGQKKNDATESDQSAVKDQQVVAEVSHFESVGSDQNHGGSQDGKGDEEWDWFEESL
jgi:hypothetical protein